ncbi:MAG: flagellar protein FlaG [Azoarcus sp.]|nr:flagellar protein FlaG [Azoarcus sp.]
MNINNIQSVIAGSGVAGRAQQGPTPSSSQSSAVLDTNQASRAANDVQRSVERVQQKAAAQEMNQKQLEEAVENSVKQLNEFIRPYVTSLQFSVDKDLGKVVVKIMDSETDEVIKQIPSEEVLALTKALSKVSGLFVKQEA